MTEYLVIYEQGDTSWGAYTPDLAVAVVGETREEAERLIPEAIAFHLAPAERPRLDSNQRPAD